MDEKKITKITVEINQNISSRVMDSLKTMGIKNYSIQSGRSVVYREKSVLFGISTKLALENDPTDIYSFSIPSEFEMSVMSKITRDTDLVMPGHGSIWSEDITFLGKDSIISADNEILSSIKIEEVDFPKDLICITTIVQRGQSEEVVKSILDMGFCVPSVIFGNGTGFRDKLGLLRITVPAEKEVIKIAVAKDDAEDAMNALIDAGKLDQPGKGFIYTSPIKRGLVNTKIFRGKMMHAASMEQVIAAIDAIRGDTEWRKREAISGNRKEKVRKFLSNLIDLTLLSNEGTAEKLVFIAMQSGAAGATVSKEKFLTFLEKSEEKVSPSREKSDFIIGSGQKDVITKALTDDNCFSAEGQGVIELKEVIKACTYLGG